MSTTITETTLIDQVIDEVPGLAWKFTGTATSGGATLTTTDAEINKLGANYEAARLQTLFLWIPTGTANTDDVHSVTTMSVSAATTTITTLGNYGATYTAVSMYLIGIHPTVFRRLLNDALEMEGTPFIAPLSHIQWLDSDMSASTSSNYTDSASAVSSKVTTVASNYEQIRSLRVLNSGANHYTASASMNVTTNGNYLFWVIGRSVVGTAQAILQGSTALQTLTTTETRYQYLWATGNFGSNESVSVRLGGVGATDDTTWAAGALQPLDDAFFLLPSWADERFKVTGIMRGEFGFSSGANAADAFSRRLIPLKESVDFDFQTSYSAVNTASVHIDPRWLSYPLWIRGYRPYSDLGTFAAATDTTTCPLHILVPRVKYLIGKRYAPSFPGLMAEAEHEIAQRAALRVTVPPNQTRVHRMFA